MDKLVDHPVRAQLSYGFEANGDGAGYHGPDAIKTGDPGVDPTSLSGYDSLTTLSLFFEVQAAYAFHFLTILLPSPVHPLRLHQTLLLSYRYNHAFLCYRICCRTCPPGLRCACRVRLLHCQLA